MSKYTIRVRRPTHGTGSVPLGRPITWWGGIYGNQPTNPLSQYRTGIFRAKYGRDPRFPDDAGILAPYSLQQIEGTVMHGGKPLFNPGNGLAGITETWNELTPRQKTWATAGLLTAAILLLRR